MKLHKCSISVGIGLACVICHLAPAFSANTPSQKKEKVSATAVIRLPNSNRIPSDNELTTVWGAITSPVYNRFQTGIYSGAELFTGPNQFGNNYFCSVLPNGKIIQPAGKSIQVGEDPLGIAVTPDGKFIITSNDDERKTGVPSLLDEQISGGYSLTVIDAQSMQVVSHLSTGPLYIGLQIISNNDGYTLYASGGADNDIKLFRLSRDGVLSINTPSHIPIEPILPADKGYVSHYTLSPDYIPNTVPSPGSSTDISEFTKGFKITFPSGAVLSPDNHYLYSACNGDNSLCIIDTDTNKSIARIPVGYFPYDVAIDKTGSKILVSNQGIQEYKFLDASYDKDKRLNGLKSIKPGDNIDGLFYVPVTDTLGKNPHTSSVTVIDIPGGDPHKAVVAGSIYQGHTLDELNNVGDTHPTAIAINHCKGREIAYVTKANSDSLGIIDINTGKKLKDIDLSLLNIKIGKHKVHGGYPNALALSPDGKRLYVAEAGLNSIAVLDTDEPNHPKLVGRIPSGWYPTGVTISPNGKYLYIANAKGSGADINPKTDKLHNPAATGLQSFAGPNLLFGSVQQVEISTLTPEILADGDNAARSFNYGFNIPSDTTIVPIGKQPSPKIKHVFFILHENKTFDSMLGNLGDKYDAAGKLVDKGHFGPYAGLVFNKRDGSMLTDAQDPTLSPGTEYTQISLNTQAIAGKFAVGVNYYSDSEESDAGHQYSASGTASDYTEKTLLVKKGRGLLVNKNFEPEDYPESGYIFNNAARNGVSFKDYGALIRSVGIDTGTSRPAANDDPASGKSGFPVAPETDVISEIPGSDVTSPIIGVGESYFMHSPILAVLGGKNSNGEPHLDRNYPSFNFNISDQRRAQEFISDFDRMIKAGTLPVFLYIYQPNDHQGTGSENVTATNIPNVTGPEEIADGDVALGMVVQHIMNSSVYYDRKTGTGSAIFITYDDAQNGRDHIEPHRTPLIVVSPFVKPGYYGTRHYSTASIVKTEELLMGLPPNNYGDLFATDLRDLFQNEYNHIKASDVAFTQKMTYTATPAGRRIWTLAKGLDASSPDRDSARLAKLSILSMEADDLYRTAEAEHQLDLAKYNEKQEIIYNIARNIVKNGKDED